jgi:serine/threonine protein kinase
MSPEMIQDCDYDYKADIWSLGITAIELADQKPPLFEEHPMRVLIQIPRNPAPRVRQPQDWSAHFSHFLQFCLTKNPKDRPSASECLQHPFITCWRDIPCVVPGGAAAVKKIVGGSAAPPPVLSTDVDELDTPHRTKMDVAKSSSPSSRSVVQRGPEPEPPISFDHVGLGPEKPEKAVEPVSHAVTVLPGCASPVLASAPLAVIATNVLATEKIESPSLFIKPAPEDCTSAAERVHTTVASSSSSSSSLEPTQAPQPTTIDGYLTAKEKEEDYETSITTTTTTTTTTAAAAIPTVTTGITAEDRDPNKPHVFIGTPFHVDHGLAVKYNSILARYEYKNNNNNHHHHQQQQHPPPSHPSIESTNKSHPPTSPAVLPPAFVSALQQQFGLPLSSMRTSSRHPEDLVPCILHMLRRTLVAQNGLVTKYIYRACPDHQLLARAKAAINNGTFDPATTTQDPYLIASLIKAWFRDLPLPLLEVHPLLVLVDHHSQHSRTDHVDHDEDPIRMMREAVNGWKAGLSRQVRQILEWLVDHLLEILDKTHVNCMSLSALATVWAPNLVSLLVAPEDGYQPHHVHEKRMNGEQDDDASVSVSPTADAAKRMAHVASALEVRRPNDSRTNFSLIYNIDS